MPGWPIVKTITKCNLKTKTVEERTTNEEQCSTKKAQGLEKEQVFKGAGVPWGRCSRGQGLQGRRYLEDAWPSH